jgi:hypothetical protein
LRWRSRWRSDAGWCLRAGREQVGDDVQAPKPAARTGPQGDPVRFIAATAQGRGRGRGSGSRARAACGPVAPEGRGEGRKRSRWAHPRPGPPRDPVSRQLTRERGGERGPRATMLSNLSRGRWRAPACIPGRESSARAVLQRATGDCLRGRDVIGSEGRHPHFVHHLGPPFTVDGEIRSGAIRNRRAWCRIDELLTARTVEVAAIRSSRHLMQLKA